MRQLGVITFSSEGPKLTSLCENIGADRPLYGSFYIDESTGSEK